MYIYSLFVERAMRLVRRDGIVGQLVPSGIAADLRAAKFFRSISTTGRVGALLDFENGKRKPDPFFPDGHRSFKFCTLIAGGPARTFPQAYAPSFIQTLLPPWRQHVGFTQSRLVHIRYCKGWLGRQDSNLGMAESKSAALPLGYAPPCHIVPGNLL